MAKIKMNDNSFMTLKIYKRGLLDVDVGIRIFFTNNIIYETIAPKRFLCRYPLKLGALYVSVLMICISIASGFALLGQIVKFESCTECPRYLWRNTYGFSVTAIVYSLIMLATHIWLIFGIKCNKSSIILSWVVISSMWLSLTLCLLIVLICMYSTEANFVAWLLSLIFGLIAIGILVYTVLIVYGFWLELKEQEKENSRKLVIVTSGAT